MCACMGRGGRGVYKSGQITEVERLATPLPPAGASSALCHLTVIGTTVPSGLVYAGVGPMFR